MKLLDLKKTCQTANTTSFSWFTPLCANLSLTHSAFILTLRGIHLSCRQAWCQVYSSLKSAVWLDTESPWSCQPGAHIWHATATAHAARTRRADDGPMGFLGSHQPGPDLSAIEPRHCCNLIFGARRKWIDKWTKRHIFISFLANAPSQVSPSCEIHTSRFSQSVILSDEISPRRRFTNRVASVKWGAILYAPHTPTLPRCTLTQSVNHSDVRRIKCHRSGPGCFREQLSETEHKHTHTLLL